MNGIEKEIETLRGLAATAWQANAGAAKSAICDTHRALKRIINRAAPLPAEYERVEIVQQRGPTLEFSGRLLAEHSYTTRHDDPLKVEFEVWETPAGALVAVSSTEPVDRDGVEICRATIVPPQDDIFAMRCAVMDHFEWNQGARSMARQQLDWNLKMEVE